VGYYDDTSGQAHGFLRDASGAYTTIDVPNRSTTNAYGINSLGEIVGATFDPNLGFLRDNSGAYTSFDAAGANGTIAYGINGMGQIVGSANLGHEGFVRNADGTLTTFSTPGSNGFGWGINDSGEIVGQYQDGFGHVHGFEGTLSSSVAPVPEPPTWIGASVAVLCGVSAGWLSRRRCHLA
jgi:hypothetical protein